MTRNVQTIKTVLVSFQLLDTGSSYKPIIKRNLEAGLVVSEVLHEAPLHRRVTWKSRTGNHECDTNVTVVASLPL